MELGLSLDWGHGTKHICNLWPAGQDAIKYMGLLKAEYASIVDESGEIIDRLKRTAE
jgi:hypothetical protein